MCGEINSSGASIGAVPSILSEKKTITTMRIVAPCARGCGPFTLARPASTSGKKHERFPNSVGRKGTTSGQDQNIQIDPAKLDKAIVRYGVGSIFNVAAMREDRQSPTFCSATLIPRENFPLPTRAGQRV